MMESKARTKLRLTIRWHDLLASVGDVGGPTSMLTRPCPFNFCDDDPQNAFTPFALG
jgi:hypothetical protein